MPRPRKGPHIYRRAGRPGWWGYIDRDTKDIALETEDETDAYRRLSELLDERRRVPGQVQSTTSRETTLAKLFDRRIEELKSAGKQTTAREAKYDAVRWLKWFRAQEPAIAWPRQVDPDVLRRYRQFRRGEGGEGVTAARFNRELTNLKMAMLIGTEEPYRCVTDEQILIFKKARLKEPRPVPHQLKMTFEEHDKFFATIQKRDERYATLCTVLAGTAMREAEIVHLDETDLFEDLDNDIYEIGVSNKKPGWCKCHPEGWTTKNYRCRRVPVEHATIDAARAFIRARTEDPNFSRSERKILTQDVGRMLGQARQRLGLSRHATAKLAEIGYRSYYYYEEGEMAPSPLNCIKLERALKLAEGSIPRVSRYGTTFSLDQKRIWTEIAEACKDAGIRHFSPHAFRHAWASRMFNAGFGIEQVSKWLGHSDVEVTKRYLGMTDEHRPTGTEIRAKLAKLRGRSSAGRPRARRG